MSGKFGWIKSSRQKAASRSIRAEREDAAERRAKKRRVKPLLFEKERQAMVRQEALKSR